MTMTTRKTRRAGAGSRLSQGFDSLTLDPSPRLRRLREEMEQSRPATFEDVWKSIGRAMFDAMATVTRTFKADR